MHEFSLCQNIVRTVNDHLKENKLTHKSVHKVVLSVGELAGVDIASLSFWFPVVCRDTLLDEAEFEIITESASAECLSCQKSFTIKHRYDACPHCQSYEKKVLSGENMIIKNIEVI